MGEILGKYYRGSPAKAMGGMQSLAPASRPAKVAARLRRRQSACGHAWEFRPAWWDNAERRACRWCGLQQRKAGLFWRRSYHA